MTTLLDWTKMKCAGDEFKGGEFKDKVYLVTGAADGIGRAVSIALAEQGATVLLLDKKARHLEKLFDSIVARGFTEPVILPVDLLEVTPETATFLAQSIKDDIGQIHGLVHCAAELGSPSPMDQYDMRYWNDVFQTNLQAPYFLTRALLPLLKQDDTTHVIFTSADVARVPEAYWGAYGIAGAGLEAQAKIWAEELEKVSNIRVNTLDPGPVRTAFRRRSHPGESQDSLITPQQIAAAYLAMLLQSELHGEQIRLQD